MAFSVKCHLSYINIIFKKKGKGLQFFPLLYQEIRKTEHKFALLLCLIVSSYTCFAHI